MQKLNILSIRSQASVLFIMSMAIISACHDSTTIQNVDSKNTQADHQPAVQMDQGKKLTEVAGKATLPRVDPHRPAANQIPEHAKKYIGRYQVEMNCSDPFVECDAGMSEYILNLLADGSAHRIFIHLGKVTYANNNQYRHDSWYFDEKANQIVLHRGTGVEFYYDVSKDQKLTMNIDKIATANEINRAYFAAGNPLPAQRYSLKKMLDDR